MDRQKVLKIMDRINDLPTLPLVAVEVNRMLQNDETTIRKLSQTIEKDQAIVCRILKLVNSAFFGLRSQVSSIPDAVALLGFNMVRNVVISVSIIESFSIKGKNFDIQEFWKHSIAVAIISKKLSEISHISIPEDCFLAGLLHDIGKVLLFQHFPDQFRMIWKKAEEDRISFHNAEKKIGFMGHARMGAYLCRKWQLPARLVDVIKYHHTPTGRVMDLELLIVTHTANTIANAFLGSFNPGRKFDDLHPKSDDTIKATVQNINTWFPSSKEEVYSACRFFLDNSVNTPPEKAAMPIADDSFVNSVAQ